MLVNTHTHRTASERGSDRAGDTGSTLVSVLVVMLVLTLGGVALAAIVMNTTGSLVDTRSRTQAQAAVDAGIAAQTANLESGLLDCGSTTQGDAGVPVNASEGPTYDWTLSCDESSTPAIAVLKTEAAVNGAKASRQAVFHYTASHSRPPTAGGPGLFYTYGMTTRLNHYQFDSANSEVGIDEFVGSAGVYASTGNIACGSPSVFPADVYTKTGNLQLDWGCVIEGNAYIGGKADINGGTIEGDLVAPKNVEHLIKSTVGTPGGDGGNVLLGGTFTLNGGTVYGSVSASGTGTSTLGSGTIHKNFRYKGGYGLWGTPAGTIVKGTIVKDTSLSDPAMPEIPVWQDVTFQPVNDTTPPKAWADEGYRLTTVTGAACNKWSGNSADVTSLTSALSNKMIFDIRACTGAFDTNAGGANKEVRVNQDVAVIANRWYLSGTKFSSADGAEHTIHLITPDGQPGTAGPQCISPAGNSEQVNDSRVDPKIAVYLYTPCLMKFNSGSATFRGQVYSGDLSFGGGVKVAFAPRNVPGYDFGAGVETPGSGGSPGGGGGERPVFTLQSTRDLPTP